MAKSKRRKTRPKRRSNKQTSTGTLSQTDLIVIQRIGAINALIPYLGFFSAFYLLYDGIFNHAKIAEAAGWLFYVCSGSAVPFMLIGIHLSKLAKQEREKPRINLARHRKLGIWTMAISIFVNILGLMPLLYGAGYISRLAKFLPGRELIGNKLSVGIAFVLGAVVSGVLGNLAYDGLRFLVRTMVGSKH